MTTDATRTRRHRAGRRQPARDTADPRLRELLTGLVRHLHAFARETRLTQEEWERAIGFLTATGQACTDIRQEFILLSDVLGPVDARGDDQRPARRPAPPSRRCWAPST